MTCELLNRQRPIVVVDRRRAVSIAGIDTGPDNTIVGANPIRQLPALGIGITRRSCGTLAKGTPLITLTPGESTACQRSVL
jgi:hypothetical protein